MGKPIRVLIVEDSEDDTFLLLRELRHGDYDPAFLRVDRPEAMKNALEKLPWDIVITDYTMPHFSGLSALTLVREMGLDLPVLIVSGSIGEDVAVACMKAGANDYIMKGHFARLVPAVERELREAKERRARREAEKQLLAAERLRMVGEVAASVIHDLKNPMQVILSTMEFMDVEGLAAEKRAQYRQSVDRQLARMLEMCQEILEFSRGEMQLHLRPVHFPELCDEVVETYRKSLAGNGVLLTFAGRVEPGTSPKMPMDREKFWRVFSNLIGNAGESLAGGGEIQLRLSMTEGEAELEVQDTGRGIPEEVKQKLFQPFATFGKSRGTGLGLLISKNIVEAHGGAIDFTSEEGVGTTFRIHLPRRPAPERVDRKTEKRMI